MTHNTILCIGVALLSASVLVSPVYGQLTNDTSANQYDNEEILSFAMLHTIQAINSLETGNSTDVSIHLSIANEQVNEVLARKLASSSAD